MKYGKIYQKLKQKYTDEEITDTMFIPADLTEVEKVELAKEMKSVRMQKLRETTEEDRILADVMRLRFQMENYVKKGKFSFDQTFGKYLEEYCRIIKKSKKQFAKDLAVHYTKLSRVVNDRDEPNIELCYRLEKHTGFLLKAELWWKLIMKKQEFMISKNDEARIIEYDKVKNPLRA